MSDEQELRHLSHVIGMAAFAVEARRVLSEIDHLAAAMPQVDDVLAPIATRHEWSEMPNTVAEVLRSVHYRLDALLDGL